MSWNLIKQGIIQPFVKIADLDLQTIERVMNVNWWGVVYMTKTYLPLLLARPEAHVCNISSMGGFLPVPGQSCYGASKAAVKLFTEGLHSELAGTKVGVTIVFPGAIETHITENSGVKISSEMEGQKGSYKLTSPKDAAKMILDGIEGNKYRVLVGQDAGFMDKIYRLSPERAAAFIANKMKSLLKD
jgi:short-subunit dehydrogenase